jgi:long-subunit acyl-CoA synthetase (AMP-forming)
MRTFSSLFLECVVRYPQKTFIRRANGETFTYAQAGEVVASVLKQFDQLGIKRGDRVVIFAELNFPAVFIHIAGYSSGIIPIPIGPRFSYGFMKDAAKRVEAKQVFCDEYTLPILREQGDHPLFFAPDTSTERGALKMRLGLSYSEAVQILRKAQEDLYDSSILKLMCTSGSTGKPNIVVRRNRFFPVIEDQVWKICRNDGERRFLLAGSLTHGFAHTSLSTILSMGGELLMPTLIDTNIDLDEVRRLDPHILPMTPRVLRSFYFQAQEKGYPDIFGPSAKMMVLVGGKPDQKFLDPVMSKGVEFVEIYGSSEAGLCAGTPYRRYKEGFSGTVFPFADVKIASDGEILVRSPNSALGYYDDVEKTKEVFLEDGFIRTGDLGVFSEDGYLKVFGRKKDVFSTYEGSAVYPTRIESMIETFSWVEQVILVGDGMPYISAMIVLKGQEYSSGSPDGYLDKKQFQEAYRKFAPDLMKLNRELESIEKIRRFSLFVKSFDTQAYSYVSGAKVNRNRKVFTGLYSSRINELYTDYKPTDVDCLAG